MTATTTAPRRLPLLTAGLAAGIAAAIVVLAVALSARSAGVSLDIDGEPIPLLAFPQLTVVGALLGVALAAVTARRSGSPRHTFTVVATALAAASCVLPFLVPAAAGTQVLLVAEHLLAAAIVIPVLAARLDR